MILELVVYTILSFGLNKLVGINAYLLPTSFFHCTMLHHTIYHYIWPILRHTIQGLCQLSFAFRKNY